MGNGTSLGRVRGLGSSHSGAHHWLLQRYTAVGNLLGGLYLAFGLLRAPAYDYETLQVWLHKPLSAVLGRQLGYVLYRARRYDEGIAVLQKTLELEPTHLTAYFYLGHCLLLQGKRAEALTAFQKANEISPHLPDFLAILGYTHAVLGQREQALQYQAQLTELARKSGRWGLISFAF